MNYLWLASSYLRAAEESNESSRVVGEEKHLNVKDQIALWCILMATGVEPVMGAFGRH